MLVIIAYFNIVYKTLIKTHWYYPGMCTHFFQKFLIFEKIRVYKMNFLSIK